MKLKTLVAFSLLSFRFGATLLNAQSAPPPPPPRTPSRPLTFLDPQMPKGLSADAEKEVLHELSKALSGMNIQNVFTTSSNSLLVRTDPEELKAVEVVLAESRKRVAQRLGKINARYAKRNQSRKPPALLNSPLQITIKLVIASKKPLPKGSETLEGGLSDSLRKALGYTSFEVIGTHFLEASVSRESRLVASVDWNDWKLKLETRLEPTLNLSESIQVEAEFKVFGSLKTPSENSIHSELKTSYKPRAQKPLVVGVTPFGEGKAFLYVLTHEGIGLTP